MRVKELTNPSAYTTLFLFHKKLFCEAKAFTKLLRKVLSKTLRGNTSFFGKAFFSKETFMTHRDIHEHENNKVFSYQRFVLKEKEICYVRFTFLIPSYVSKFLSRGNLVVFLLSSPVLLRG